MLSKILSIVIGSICVVATAAYVYARADLLPLDASARKNAPGRFVELSEGPVHFEWHGPKDGPVTVLVHGFSVPSFVFAGLIEPMTSAGLRVLTYDNYGRGFSVRPHTRHDAELFDQQLLELLASQHIEAPINLVGYSMGGAIAAYFSANHPEKVRRLGLIAPAGFPIRLDPTIRLLRLPIIGDWLMEIVGRGAIRSRISSPGNQGRAIPDMAERFGEQMKYKGFIRSLLSTLRHYPMGDLSDEYSKIGRSPMPVLAIWGDLDSTVPPENAKPLAEAIPQAEFETIVNGTHAITYSEPEQVSRRLIKFFGR